VSAKERPILFSAPMVRAILEGRKSQTRRVVKPQPVLNLDSDDIHKVGLPESKGLGYYSGSTPYRWSKKDRAPDRTPCPYGAPGDRLWVREPWKAHSTFNHLPPRDIPQSRVFYLAGPEAYSPDHARYRHARFMPRWASRILLEVTDERVERLQAISEADAVAEGAEASAFPGPWWQGYKDFDGELIHQQATGEQPPDWMIEPKPMRSMKHLDRSAVDQFRALWFSINGLESWDANPWVWVISFRRLESADCGVAK
jgi:hypothetical protein